MSKLIRADEMDLMGAQNAHVGSHTGAATYRKLLVSEENGFSVTLQHICRGNVSPAHVHTCGHGMYVLKGVLHTNFSDFGKGSFVWFCPGCVMEHGAVEEDVDCLFLTDAPFDIRYLEDGAELPSDDDRFFGVHGEDVTLEYRPDMPEHLYGRKTLFEDPRLGFEVKVQHFEPEVFTTWHTHTCAHGMYVLGGTLETSLGEAPAGSFVWFDAGEAMEHGTHESPADLLFITDGPFEITFAEQEG